MNDRQFPARLAALRRPAAAVAAIGGVILLSGLRIAPARAWADLLLASFAMVCLGLSGIFFVALQYATGAVWSIPLRRVGEALAAVLPVGSLGILAVLLLHPAIYPWYGHSEIVTEGWAGFKHAWLSYPFFLVRAVIYLAAWLGFSSAIRRNSRRQDREGGIELSRKNTRLSVAFMVVFGVTFWLASTDWVMSLEPHWASTIFGIYHFSGMFLSGLATLALLALALRATGPLRHGVSNDQFLDLGRLIVAFATFWAYIWFSQYMLIWYANLTEETSYMVLRTSSGWGSLFVVNLLLNWTLPFLLLLPRANKINPRTLAAASLIVLLGRVCDLYLMIIPPFSAASSRPAIWDFAALSVAAAGLFLVTMRSFFASEPIPVGDPFLSSALKIKK
ncbi:MAG: hypothetical protein LAN84_11770 [Acidobacteriia bacterium]|nr:hypothetical protein [Terriglobia bacterium]